MFVLRIIIVGSFGMLGVTQSNSQQAARFLGQDSARTDIAKGLYPEESVENQKNDEYIKQTYYLELCFIVAAAVTLLFTLIYYKYQRETYENYLLTLLAAKDHSLLIVQKELSLLKEEGRRFNVPALERNSEIKTMNLRLNKSEDIISSQALRIKILELEKKELTNIGMEMHTLLSSLFESYLKSTEKLNTIEEELVESENAVAALTQETLERNSEIKTMNLRLNKSEDIISSQALRIKILELEKKELTNIGMEMHTLLSSLFESYLKSTEKLNTIEGELVESENAVAALTQEINTESMLKESKLLDEINCLQHELDKQTNSLIAAENEVSLSRKTLRKIDSEETESFLWGIKLSSELEIANQTCEMYKQILGVILKSNGEYLDQIDTLKCNIINLKDNVSELEGEKEESTNKLNIMKKFFKEQEKEYQKQINEKVILYDDKQRELSNLNERIQFLNKEISNYKSEIRSLKTEIIDQETNFEKKISATDKIVSNYWTSCRQAKRKLKEMELETARLRYKITMDKKFENCTKSMDISTILDTPIPILSPDFVLLDFEPPPPMDSSDFTLLNFEAPPPIDSPDFTLVDFEPLPPIDSSDLTFLDFELPPPLCSY